jgi:hypothetical protein
MEKARYFVVKSANLEGLQKSIDRSLWATPLQMTSPHHHEVLNAALSVRFLAANSFFLSGP